MASVQSVLRSSNALKILTLLLVTIIVFIFILYSCHQTNSLALTSFLYLTLFDITSLLTSLVTLWSSKQRPTTAFSFGFDRANVLAVFASSLIVILSVLTVIKHSTQRVIEPPEIFTNGMVLPLVFGVTVHFLDSNLVKNKAMIAATEGASANFIQNALSDFGHSICGVSPVLGRLLMRRMNPLALLVIISSCIIMITKFLIDLESLYLADVVATLLISFLVCGTLVPLTIYCGKILLQTTPSRAIPVLDKSLREISTLDGVLECRNEHFWMITFGTLAGSLHVRVRRDACEQEVLRKVTTLLAPHISHLTVQVTKDDWSLPLTMSTSSVMTMSQYKSPPTSPPSAILPLRAATHDIRAPPTNFTHGTLPSNSTQVPVHEIGTSQALPLRSSTGTFNSLAGEPQVFPEKNSSIPTKSNYQLLQNTALHSVSPTITTLHL